MSRGFLSVAEAAEALGLSRLRVREAVARGLLVGRRDNRGHLRVDAGAAPQDLLARMAGPPPAEVIDGLFDEVAELSDLLAERDAELARATALAAGQDEALARAAGLLDADAARADHSERLERALALLERSVAELEASRAETARLSAVAGRALDAVGRMEAALAEREEALRAREAALERALDLAERAVEARRPAARGGWWGRMTGRGARGMA